MTEHIAMSKAEEHLAMCRRADSNRSAEHEAEASYLTTRLRHPNLGGRGNSSTRAQVSLDMQRTHGNRAVQRFTPRSSVTVQRESALLTFEEVKKQQEIKDNIGKGIAAMDLGQ